MEKRVSIAFCLAVWTAIINTTFQIYVPDEEINQKPVTYTPGIETSYRRPYRLHHNYSRVFHQNTNSYSGSFSQDDETAPRLYPVYNAHTYGARPQKLTQIYVLNGTRIRNNTNPTRQVVIYNKEKRTPKVGVYKTCPRNATGQFVYESSCNQFLNCWRGRGYVQNCAPGTLFNPKTLECDFPEKVYCISGPRQTQLRKSENIRQIGCPQDFSGLIPNYTDCSKFINCVGGIENFMDCPVGTLFDINKNICDFAHKASCFNGQNEKLVEQNIDGKLDFASNPRTENQEPRYRHNEVRCPYGVEGLVKHPSDCSKFINCAHGQMYVQDCSPGTLFNPVLKICDFPYNVRCENSTESGIRVVDYDAGYYQNQNRGKVWNSQDQGSFNNHRGLQTSSVYDHGGSSNQYGDNSYDSQPTNLYEDGSHGFESTSGGHSSHSQSNQYGSSSYNYPRPGNNALPNQYDFNSPNSNSNQYRPASGSTIFSTPYVDRYYGSNSGSKTFSNSYAGNSYNSDTGGFGNGYYETSTNPYRDPLYSGRPDYNTNPSNQHSYGSTNQNRYKGEGSQIYSSHQYRPIQPESNNRKIWSQEPRYDTNHQLTGSYGTSSIDRNYFTGTKTPDTHSNDFYNQQPINTHINQELYRPERPIYHTQYDRNSTMFRPLVQRHETIYPTWQNNRNDRPLHNSNSLDEEIATPNYDQVVNINYRRKTTVPYRNSYEPFFGTTASSRSNDYDDTYTPGHSNKFIRATTPSILEKSWPPPFPSTDVNADYVFAYEDGDEVTLEAENVKHNSNECGKNDFHCGQNECISKPLVCNGLRDCANGKDEENCLNHVARFSLIKNKKLAILEKERWDNVSIAACSLLCIESQKLHCRSFNYRKIDKTCFLTDTNEALTGALISYYPFDYYELNSAKINCSDMYICQNKKCIETKKICDGRDDCGDRMDEKGCKPEDFGYSVRLSGSRNKNEGQIEVTAFGKTGFVCDDKFGLIDANVVCKELGFHLGAVEVKGNSYFSSFLSENPFFMMDDVTCSGNETRLLDCDFSGWGVHNCLGQEIAGVVCKTPTEKCASDYWQCDTGKECLPLAFVCDGLLDCTDGSDEGTQHCDAPIQIRLVNGTSQSEGRVEIRHHGIWGTICDDDFNEDAAKVICRQLGYTGAASVKKDSYFGSGHGPIWLDQVFCSGNETRVENCSHWNWGEHNCDHNEDVGVICNNRYEYEERHSLLVEPVRLPRRYPDRCGYRNDNIFNQNDDVHFRVVKGSIAKKGDYPWQAAIRVKGKSSTTHWCGAVIISEKFVLTAAHCLIGYSKGSYVIVAGDYNVDDIEGTEQEVHIEDFYLHEDFRRGHKMNNDIALVKLKGRGFRLGDDVQAICLPDSDTSYETNQNCTISGFGSIESGKSAFSHNLRAGWVPLQKREVCTMPHVYGDALTEGMVCAGSLDEGVDSCDGDSGGPLACLNRGVFTLYGITSWGQRCGYANKPGVYVKVAHYRQWIDAKFQKYSVN